MRNAIFLLCLSLVLVTAIGCKKKNPDTSGDLVITEPTGVQPGTTDVTAGAEPTIPRDQTADPLSQDLYEVNEYVAREGLLGDIFYGYDSYDLADDARDRLSRNARFLVENPQFIVTIEGHADERGTNDYNLALGERRANAARDYLTSLGVARERMRTVSYGEERPFCTQTSESCWAQNRRAHFSISGRTNAG